MRSIEIASPEIASPKIGGILLAAGASSRFGTSKQVARFHGQPLLSLAAAALKHSSANPIVAVIRTHQPEHEELLKRAAIPYILNPLAEAGMSTSLRAGLEFHGPAHLDAVLIITCDQPLILASHLQALVARWARTQPPAMAAAYSGILGVPAIFASILFPKLASLTGDQGAGKLLRSMPETVPFHLPEAAFDADTPELLSEIEWHSPSSPAS